MAKKAQAQTETLTIQFGTRDTNVEATAVASTMQAVAAIVAETQVQLASNQQVLLKARPFAKGSFVIPLELILVGAGALLEHHPLLLEILDALKRYLEIRQLLKGKALPVPEKDGSFIIDGSHITIQNSVINLISNSRVNNAVDKAASDLTKDESIKDMKLFQGDSPKPMSVIKHADFEYLRSEPTIDTVDKGNRSRVVIALLTIRSTVFEGSGKWSFNFEGAKINARISDDEFKRRVETGIEQFAAGDRLEAELRISEEYNHQIADYERKAYEIIEVRRHIKRPPPAKSKRMFDAEES